MEEIIPISDLQAKAKKFVEAAKSGDQRIIVTQRGRAAAVLIGYEEYRSLTATSTEKADPEALKMLNQAMRQSSKGERRELQEVLEKITRRRSA